MHTHTHTLTHTLVATELSSNGHWTRQEGFYSSTLVYLEMPQTPAINISSLSHDSSNLTENVLAQSNIYDGRTIRADLEHFSFLLSPHKTSSTAMHHDGNI